MTASQNMATQIANEPLEKGWFAVFVGSVIGAIVIAVYFNMNIDSILGSETSDELTNQLTDLSTRQSDFVSHMAQHSLSDELARASTEYKSDLESIEQNLADIQAYLKAHPFPEPQ